MREIWYKFATLIHFRVHKEQLQTKNKEIRGVQERKQSCKNSRKVANWFPRFRSIQSILVIPINCWTPQDQDSITSKLPHALKHAVRFIQFPYFLDFKYHNSGIFSMIHWYILNPWDVCKLMVIFNCIFVDCISSCHG